LRLSLESRPAEINATKAASGLAGGLVVRPAMRSIVRTRRAFVCTVR